MSEATLLQIYWDVSGAVQASTKDMRKCLAQGQNSHCLLCGSNKQSHVHVDSEEPEQPPFKLRNSK